MQTLNRAARLVLAAACASAIYQGAVAQVSEQVQITQPALTFAEAYRAALQFDAQYQSAGHELESAQLGVPIAKAALLPSVSINVSNAKVVGTREFPNSLNQDVLTRLDYASPQASLTLRMPIFNYEANRRWQQSKAQAEVAGLVFRARGLEFMDRLASAYLQVLLSEEARQLVQSQTRLLQTQLGQAQQRLQRGEGTRVDVALLQSSIDTTNVRLLEANDQLVMSRRQLQRVTGLPTPPLKPIPTDFMPVLEQAEPLSQWLELAMRQSPTIQARQQALVVAQLNVQRNFAGHMPRLDMVASLSRSQNETLNTLNQTSTLRSIGVQLSVPLYSGGGVDASVKQAMADKAKAEEDLRSERESVAVDVEHQHQAVSNGAAKMAGYRRAVESSELTLEGTRRALLGGLSTTSEVADAQARLYAARRDLAQARVEYLLARTRLMVLTGMPMDEVVTELDRTLAVWTESATATAQ